MHMTLRAVAILGGAAAHTSSPLQNTSESPLMGAMNSERRHVWVTFLAYKKQPGLNSSRYKA